MGEDRYFAYLHSLGQLQYLGSDPPCRLHLKVVVDSQNISWNSDTHTKLDHKPPVEIKAMWLFARQVNGLSRSNMTQGWSHSYRCFGCLAPRTKIVRRSLVIEWGVRLLSDSLGRPEILSKSVPPVTSGCFVSTECFSGGGPRGRVKREESSKVPGSGS